MSYAIFRSMPIKTLRDLGHIGSHNLRKKEAYKSNPDIDKSLSDYNISLIDCNGYYKDYMKLVQKYKTQHNKRMQTIREDRKKSFSRMLDDSNSVVADEMLFTSDTDFFKGMNRDEIKRWAKTCMDFVYEDMGYKEEQILNAIIHLDEKTPHLHVVAVPLIQKLDKRSKKEVWTISKKQYIRDKTHLSELQDKYHDRLIQSGFNLMRGIKNSDNEHIPIKEYKKITKKLTNDLDKDKTKLTNEIYRFEEQMLYSKESLIGNDYVKVKKETLESMTKIIKQSNKIINKAPKVNKLMEECDKYLARHDEIRFKNLDMQREIIRLKQQNDQLEYEKNQLKKALDYVIELIKTLFRNILKLGTPEDKDMVVKETTKLYENKLIYRSDLYDIGLNTIKENELLDIDKNKGIRK